LFLPALLAVTAASDYTGAAACQRCHAAECRAQSASAHAAALAPSKPPQPGEWAFGAGMQAITFVSRRDPEHYIELGETWYRKINGFALTPGHRDGAGVPYRIFDPFAAILRCFACHSTGPLSFDAGESIIPHEPGVRCEACHGPAAAHARDPRRNAMPDPKRLNANDLNNLCGACHRMPAAAGDATDLHNPWNARHQPLLLAASACFRESKGRLSCVVCHSPHAPLERRLAAYDAVCKHCHGAPGHTSPRHTQPVGGRACADCHMPQARPGPNLAFTNHRIAVYSPADPMSPVLTRLR
jgi:hypothetical protein